MRPVPPGRASAFAAALVLAVIVIAGPVRTAASERSATDVEDLKHQIEELRQEYETRLADLEARLGELSARPSAEPPPPSAAEVAELGRAPSPMAAPPASPAGGPVRARLLDLSFSGLFAAGTSTAQEPMVRELQGGAHDPHDRGFTVQNLELSLAGAVDPYVRGDAHLIFQVDDEGESLVEVEEAYLTTLALPRGLQLKAGQYFTEFGRLNPQHPHQWQFVDQPVVNTRMFGGDGLRGPGARLSWLTPARWYSEILVGAQRAKGETMASFLSSAEEDGFAGHPFLEKDVRSADDLLLALRWLNSVEVSPAAALNLGASALLGPNATGEDAETSIVGLDVYYKWIDPGAEKGWPFITVQAEALRRDYEAGAFVDDLTGAPVAAERLVDWGAYAQTTWGFRPRWTIGARLDWADGESGIAADRGLDPLRDRRRRVSAALTWLPTEYSRLRLQANHDEADFLRDGAGGSEQSFWIQWEFNLGAHGAHSF